MLNENTYDAKTGEANEKQQLSDYEWVHGYSYLQLKASISAMAKN